MTCISIGLRENAICNTINCLSKGELDFDPKFPSNLVDHARKFFAMVSSALVLGNEGGEPSSVAGVDMAVRNFLCACDMANIWFCSRERNKKDQYYKILWELFVPELVNQITRNSGECLSEFSQEILAALQNKDMLVLLATKRCS